MAGHPFAVAADLAGAPAPAAAPGGVEVEERAVVPLALAKGGPGDGVGEQLHGVPGEEREQGGGPGRRDQLPDEQPVATPYGTGRRGRPPGRLVDPSERPPVRHRPAAAPYQLPDVLPYFPEPHDPGLVGVPEPRTGRHQPGLLDPAAQRPDGVEPFAWMTGRQQIQTNPSGIEPQRHVPVTA
ncbi:hypothetical protein GPN2_11262 [Streptomyces murinus]